MSETNSINTPYFESFELKVVEGQLGFHAFLIGISEGKGVDLLPIQDVPPMRTYQDAEELALVVLWQNLDGCTDHEGHPLNILN